MKKIKTKSVTKILRKANIDKAIRKRGEIGEGIANPHTAEATVRSYRVIQAQLNDIFSKSFRDQFTPVSIDMKDKEKTIDAINFMEDNHVTYCPFNAPKVDPSEIIHFLLRPLQPIYNEYSDGSRTSFDNSLYNDQLLLSVNLNRPKEDILNEITKLLDIHLTNKKTRLTWLKKYKHYFQVWDERRLRKPFSQIAKELCRKEDTVRKQFYRAYELIYGKKFDPETYEKPEIKREYLKKECNSCEERSVCSELCPDVIALVNQDTKAYQREKTGFDTTK